MLSTIPFFTVPSAPTTTGITTVFICHILCISSSRSLYLLFFSFLAFFFFLLLLLLLLLVGFESNLNNNAVHKKEKYVNLINEMSRDYRCVRFVNLSMSSLGVFCNECSTFLDMMNDIGIDKKQQRYIIKKMINIAIRATYYIFCCRNRNWDSPDLMQFGHIFVFFIFIFWILFCFVFVICLFLCFFLIIQSQAAFVNCLYIVRVTIVQSKTQINLSTRLGDVNNHIAEHHLQTKHQIDWDSATCITYSYHVSFVFFLIIQSQAAFVNCLYIVRVTMTSRLH